MGRDGDRTGTGRGLYLFFLCSGIMLSQYGILVRLSTALDGPCFFFSFFLFSYFCCVYMCLCLSVCVCMCVCVYKKERESVCVYV